MKFRPRFECAPLSAGLKWVGGHGFRFEEKLDGCWHVIEAEGNTIVGEQMRDGRFFAFDIVRLAGVDVRQWSLRERLKVLDGFNLLRPAHGNGGEFLASVLARGGEGVVIKNLEAPFGVGWIKCKRTETFDCVVMEKDSWRGSIHLMLDGEDCGWCPARRLFNEVAVGDVVEVAALRRNASGKLREPRLLRLRTDKQVQHTSINRAVMMFGIREAAPPNF